MAVRCVKRVPGVMEGYSVDRAASLANQNAHTDASDAVAEPTQIFQSARDINHRVLNGLAPSPFSSPKKRSRYNYEADDALEEEEGEDMEIDPMEVNLQTPAKDRSQRAVKPLRRTLFFDASIASKPPISQNRTSYAGHDTSRSGNPFIE
jgi:hypothetical protein